MKKIKKKKHLEMLIQPIPSHPNPKVKLEQYSTPSIIASDLIWNAYSLGDIDSLNILDLGCGTGILSIAAAYLGALNVVGVDIDLESIDIAKKFSINLDNINFVNSDISDFSHDLKFDTVIQNPPFGSQEKTKKGQDIKFIKKAIDFNPFAIYSFHMASSKEFIVDFFEDSDYNITHIFNYKFNIPKIYDFHNKENYEVKVIVIRFENSI